jgi:hypothetical protein
MKFGRGVAGAALSMVYIKAENNVLSHRHGCDGGWRARWSIPDRHSTDRYEPMFGVSWSSRDGMIDDGMIENFCTQLGCWRVYRKRTSQSLGVGYEIVVKLGS